MHLKPGWWIRITSPAVDVSSFIVRAPRASRCQQFAPLACQTWAKTGKGHHRVAVLANSPSSDTTHHAVGKEGGKGRGQEHLERACAFPFVRGQRWSGGMAWSMGVEGGSCWGVARQPGPGPLLGGCLTSRRATRWPVVLTVLQSMLKGEALKLHRLR